MPLSTIKEIFKNPWGIVEHCRQEIESSGAGGFDRILNREIESHFLSAKAVAVFAECCESTARKWMNDKDARYIELSGVRRYFVDDVVKIKMLREERKRAAELKRKSKKSAA